MTATLTGDQTTDSHPVAVMLLRVLRKGRDELYELDGEGQGRLQEQMTQYLTSRNLEEAATVVANLAYFMTEKKDCPKAARALLEVTERCVLALEAKGVDAGVARTTLADIGRRFQLFTGSVPVLQAPKMGQPPPPGTIKAAALQPPRPRR